MRVAAALWWKKSVGLPRNKQQRFLNKRILAIITDYKEKYFCVARKWNLLSPYQLNVHVAVAMKILQNSTSFINAQTDKKQF